jgi:hypothetical protein
MAISDSSLSVDVWNEMRTCLVAAAPYITNSSTSATTAASIKATYNDETASKPLIVIEESTTSESMNKFGGTEGRKFINVTVDCYYNNSLGTAQLVDQCRNAIKAYSWPGMEVVAFAEDVAFNTSNRSKVFLKSLTVTFDRE